MRRSITAVLTGIIVISGAAASQAAAVGLMQRGVCPRKDAAVVILSKDPYCSAHHLSGDSCQARWQAYWFATAQHNQFLEQCRMRHWPEHKS